MAITFVQQKEFHSSGSAANPIVLAATFDAAPIVGNFIIVAIYGYTGGSVIGTITMTDNKGNVYTNDVAMNDTISTGMNCRIHSAQVCGTGAPFRFSVSFGNAALNQCYLKMVCMEWSGVGVLDKTAIINNRAGPNNTTGDTGATALTTADEELLVACIDASNGTITDETALSAPASGWTERFNGGAGEGQVTTVVTAAAVAARQVWTLGTSTRWMAGIATYKASPVSKAILLTGIGN